MEDEGEDAGTERPLGTKTGSTGLLRGARRIDYANGAIRMHGTPGASGAERDCLSSSRPPAYHPPLPALWARIVMWNGANRHVPGGLADPMLMRPRFQAPGGKV